MKILSPARTHSIVILDEATSKTSLKEQVTNRFLSVISKMVRSSSRPVAGMAATDFHSHQERQEHSVKSAAFKASKSSFFYKP